MVSAWRNFKNIFPKPLVIFRPEMLKFHQYSTLTGDTRVEFVIHCVLKYRTLVSSWFQETLLAGLVGIGFSFPSSKIKSNPTEINFAGGFTERPLLVLVLIVLAISLKLNFEDCFECRQVKTCSYDFYLCITICFDEFFKQFLLLIKFRRNIRA